MRWLFIWMDQELDMHFDVYHCPTKLEAALRFKADHPDDFAFAVIGGEDFGVEEFHA